MWKILLAGAGGFIGSILRYSIGLFFSRWPASEKFPFATLVINLTGCLVIGFLSRLAESRGMFPSEARAFIFVGVLGGFTTFSSFGNETFDLWRGARELSAVVNVAGHIILGLSAVWLGRLLANQG